MVQLLCRMLHNSSACMQSSGQYSFPQVCACEQICPYFPWEDLSPPSRPEWFSTTVFVEFIIYYSLKNSADSIPKWHNLVRVSWCSLMRYFKEVFLKHLSCSQGSTPKASNEFKSVPDLHQLYKWEKKKLYCTWNIYFFILYGISKWKSIQIRTFRDINFL